MRRILLLALGVLALALAVPFAASASQAKHGAHEHGHGHHHGRSHHHVKAKHARTRSFHSRAGTTDPNAPGAVTVASFANGVLTLTLADGSTVSGAVTDGTHIGCVPPTTTGAPAPATTADHGSRGRQGDQQGDDDQGDDQPGDDDHGDRHGDHGNRPNACTTSDLVAGAIVHQAILKIGGGSSEFKLVLLVKQPVA